MSRGLRKKGIGDSAAELSFGCRGFSRCRMKKMVPIDSRNRVGMMRKEEGNIS
jgi:hypothetical protein